MPALSSTIGPMRRFFVGDDVLYVARYGTAEIRGVLTDIGSGDRKSRVVDYEGSSHELDDGALGCPCYLDGSIRHDALCAYASSTSAEMDKRRVANIKRLRP